MIIFILINIAIILFIYFKYYNFTNLKKVTKEEIEDYDSIFIEYIKDKDINNSFDTLIAEIIDLSAKEYIKINYNQDEMNRYDYTILLNIDDKSEKLTEYETLVLNFLFYNKMEITRNELEIKLKNTFKTYTIQYNQIKQELRKKAIKEKIIDTKKEKELIVFRKIYIRIIIIIFIAIGILATINIINTNFIEILIYIFEQIVSIFLLSKASIYTNKGQSLKYGIDRYKIEIQNKEFLEGNNAMENIVKDRNFAKSIALHINTLAKKTFIEDISIAEATFYAKKTAIFVFLALSTIVTLGFIIARLSATLPKEVVVWIYTLYAIFAAVVTDITFIKKN